MTFDVTGMTCDNCVHHVTEAITGSARRHSRDRSRSQRTSAKVEGDFDAQGSIAAVEEEGYEAEPRAGLSCRSRCQPT